MKLSLYLRDNLGFPKPQHLLVLPFVAIPTIRAITSSLEFSTKEITQKEIGLLLLLLGGFHVVVDVLLGHPPKCLAEHNVRGCELDEVYPITS